MKPTQISPSDSGAMPALPTLAEDLSFLRAYSAQKGDLLPLDNLIADHALLTREAEHLRGQLAREGAQSEQLARELERMTKWQETRIAHLEAGEEHDSSPGALAVLKIEVAAARAALEGLSKWTAEQTEPMFESFIMEIAGKGTGGGHIAPVGKGDSFCGIQARFPHDNFEQGIAEDEVGIERWFATNEPWLCRNCVKAYAKARDKKAHPSPAPERP